MEKDSSTLKQYFQTGFKPTEENFADLIDSCVNKVDSGIIVDKEQNYVGIGSVSTPSSAYPQERLHVQGGIMLGMTEHNNAGAIRWNAALKVFQGHDGVSWKSLSEQSGGWIQDGYMTYTDNQDIGIGTESPQAKVHVNGALLIGNCPNDQGQPGMLRWNNDLQIFKNGVWKSIIKGGKDDGGVSLGYTLNQENVAQFHHNVKVNGQVTATSLAIGQEGDHLFWKIVSDSNTFAVHQSDRGERLGIHSNGEVFIHSLAIDGDIQLKNIKEATGKEYISINDDGSFALGPLSEEESRPMMIDEAGNVGIGGAPGSDKKLRIQGNLLIEDGSIQATGFTVKHIHDQSDEKIFSFNFGYVGIHKDNPSESLDVDGNIKCAGIMIQGSDRRIKDIKGRSNSQLDLETLLQIKITDFTFTDQNVSGTDAQKKVIGQQIAKVFPQAVTKRTNVIPDIFQTVSIEKGWVILSDHHLQPGDKVRVVFDDKKSDFYRIAEITTDRFRFDLDHTGTVFIYGREVDDFHTVDYQALSMLNVSATQALYEQLREQELETEKLEKALSR